MTRELDQLVHLQAVCVIPRAIQLPEGLQDDLPQLLFVGELQLESSRELSQLDRQFQFWRRQYKRDTELCCCLRDLAEQAHQTRLRQVGMKVLEQIDSRKPGHVYVLEGFCRLLSVVDGLIGSETPHAGGHGPRE